MFGHEIEWLKIVHSVANNARITAQFEKTHAAIIRMVVDFVNGVGGQVYIL
jgi:hypothetical protein